MNIKKSPLFALGLTLITLAICSGFFMFYQLNVFVHTPDPQNHPLGLEWKMTVYSMIAFVFLGSACVIISQSKLKK